MNFLIRNFTWHFDDLFALIKIQTSWPVFWPPLRIVPPQQCICPIPPKYLFIIQHRRNLSLRHTITLVPGGTGHNNDMVGPFMDGTIRIPGTQHVQTEVRWRNAGVLWCVRPISLLNCDCSNSSWICMDRKENSFLHPTPQMNMQFGHSGVKQSASQHRSSSFIDHRSMPRSTFLSQRQRHCLFSEAFYCLVNTKIMERTPSTTCTDFKYFPAVSISGYRSWRPREEFLRLRRTFFPWFFFPCRLTPFPLKSAYTVPPIRVNGSYGHSWLCVCTM